MSKKLLESYISLALLEMNDSSGDLIDSLIKKAEKEACEGWKTVGPKAGKCLMAALADVTRHRDRKLVKGPAGNPWDTAHFWTEDSKGKVYDRTADLVPPGYAYKGRTVNPESVRKELEALYYELMEHKEIEDIATKSDDLDPEIDNDALDEISLAGGIAGYSLPLGMSNSPSACKRTKNIVSKKRRGPSYYLKNS